MTLDTIAERGRLLMVAAAAVLVVDLFLDWRETVVRAGGVEVVSGTPGWSGWGWAVGALALALLGWEARTLLAGTWEEPRRRAVAALLALGLLAPTLAAYAAGGAHVDFPGVVSVHAEATLWPAHVAVGLAAAAAVGAAASVAPLLRNRRGRLSSTAAA